MILTIAQIFTSLLSKLAIMLDVVYTSSRVSVWYLSSLLRPISVQSLLFFWKWSLYPPIKLPSNSNFAESLCKLKIRRYENETSSQRRKELKGPTCPPIYRPQNKSIPGLRLWFHYCILPTLAWFYHPLTLLRLVLFHASGVKQSIFNHKAHFDDK